MEWTRALCVSTCAACIACALSFGCGGGDNVGVIGGDADAGATDAGGVFDASAATSDGGDGGSPADGALSGDGAPLGDGGSIAPRAGMATVTGGVRAKSPGYTMITTTGQSPGANGSLSSPSYRLHAGVVGATQGP
jgi:hypothetical protein